ncbi:MAG: hypothetical protein LBH18_01915, partial [Spirochaetaceae bacterium]|nr:hypothetical protein [Spirochaetaceae bacterium]
VGAARARFGAGAAIFSGTMSDPSYENQADTGSLRIIARGANALFSAGREIDDFSIEFWLYPISMENGEEPCSWTAATDNGTQNLNCSVSKNRMEWKFENFFFEPAVQLNSPVKSIMVMLGSSTPIIPKKWSHHLLRFNAETGLLEYLVNGVLEDVRHTTASGSEGGSVFLPRVGERGSFALGRRFNGIMDSVYIHSRFVEETEIHRYSSGGWARSGPVDLGMQSSSVIKVDAVGGAYNILSKKIRKNIGARDPFNFSGGAQMQFFIRSSSSRYVWDDDGWRVFIPGSEINAVKGRYIELAVWFYPGGDFETTPYLEEISVTFVKEPPPEPPFVVRAIPKDGAVELSWKPSKDENTAGYLVYYGGASGNYFGEGASHGDSPIDAGNQTSISIDNLRNGVLYYFSVSAYDNLRQTGDYSVEVSARPLRMIE